MYGLHENIASSRHYRHRKRLVALRHWGNAAIAGRRRRIISKERNFRLRHHEWLRQPQKLRPRSVHLGQQHRRLPLYGHLLDQQRQRRGIDKCFKEQRVPRTSPGAALNFSAGVEFSSFPPGRPLVSSGIIAFTPQDATDIAGIPRAALQRLLPTTPTWATCATAVSRSS